MLEGVVVKMMGPDFLLWRCLHSGPLTKETVDQPQPHPACPWEEFKRRNVPLLAKLTEVYGACAVVAMDEDRIVGQLRFYPAFLCSMAASGPGLCLQQRFPAGPADDLAARTFPPLSRLEDKTLFVHCLMTGSPQQERNPYQRKGLGAAMVRRLAEWAKANGWQAIEANAFEDLDLIYAVTGSAGKMFWEKLGFRVVETRVEPALMRENDFVKALRRQAAARGLSAKCVANQYRMRLDLTG
ncbi:MAG TPA: GNAT family N-acetyltransferase [Phycisphaerae bacterium]|nr:GNAT family N-acetyltransferase [Phycisphaerae bacterium]